MQNGVHSMDAEPRHAAAARQAACMRQPASTPISFVLPSTIGTTTSTTGTGTGTGTGSGPVPAPISVPVPPKYHTRTAVTGKVWITCSSHPFSAVFDTFLSQDYSCDELEKVNGIGGDAGVASVALPAEAGAAVKVNGIGGDTGVASVALPAEAGAIAKVNGIGGDTGVAVVLSAPVNAAARVTGIGGEPGTALAPADGTESRKGAEDPVAVGASERSTSMPIGSVRAPALRRPRP